MLLPRRKFLESGLLFGASTALVFGSARLGFARKLFDNTPLPPKVLGDPIYRFSRETFEPYVGGYFEAPNARGEMVALKLLQVDSYKPGPKTVISTRPGAETESFSLLFSADGPLSAFTSIHTLKHGALGEFGLFLTRRDGPSGEIFYEAVFNHLR